MSPEDFKKLGVIQKIEALESVLAVSPRREVKSLLGITRFELSHLMRLSKRLSGDVRELIKVNGVAEGIAKAVGRLSHDDQDQIIREVLHRRWSVRRVEAEVRAIIEGAGAHKDAAYYQQLADHIGEQIGFSVLIRPKAAGRGGEVVIKYFDYVDFDSVMDRLRVKLPA